VDRSLRRAARGLAISLVLAALAVPSPALSPEAATASQEAAAADACNRGWRDVELREDIVPEGVVARDDGLWIAGGSLLGGGRRQAAVLRLDGEDTELELPPPPDTRDSGFMGLAATADGEHIWAVGYGREVDYVAAYAARRGERGWGISETIRPEGFNAALTDVASAAGVGTWAAGFLQGSPGDQRPWVLQRISGDWQGSRPPIADGERATLAAISASDEGGVWVAGTASDGASMRPYLARRTDRGWERHAGPGVEGAALADIAVPAAGRGWAVGHRLAGAAIEPLLLGWDGSGWTVAEAPRLDPGPTLLSAVTEVDGVVSVGGTTWDAEKHRYAPFAARRASVGEWVVSIGRRGWGMGSITGISGDPGSDGWLVGRVDEGLIARICEAPLEAPAAAAPAGPASAAPEQASQFAAAGPLTGPVIAVDVAAEAGLPTESQSWGAVAADFDGDGDEDLFLGRHGARARLFRNDGGRFSESEQRFGGGDRHACAAADVDGSGLLDLYCAFGAARGTGTKHNQLWLDPGGPEPRLEPYAGGATEPLGRGRQPRFLDIDEDGDLDLFLGQETKRMDGQPSLNRAFLATGPATFEAVEVPGIDSGLAVEDLDVADYDGDGRDDLLLVYLDKRAREPRAGVRLYRNEEGPAFTDVTGASGIGTIGEHDAALADVDGDGRPDLIQLSPSRLLVSLGRGGGFEPVAEEALASGTALAAADADGDGDVDIYVLQGRSRDGSRDLILRNRGDGRAFDRLEVPAVRGGSEDDVIALDYDSDGRADFLALNGRNSERGPVQLITLRPAS
jgi:hypothetical protein